MEIDQIKEKLGISEFRKGQLEAIEKINSGKNYLMVFPTSFGKSLLYQVSGLMREGLVVVVCPVISLINDQVEKLRKKGLKATKLDGSIKPHKRSIFYAGLPEYKFLFLTPEQLNSERFKEEIQKIKVSLLVIDEAHCVVFDGFNFRPSYLNIPWAYKAMGFPQILALTATATPDTQKKIKQYLNIQKCGQKIGEVGRDDLNIFVYKSDDKVSIIDKILEKHFDQRGIIYCSTIKECNNLKAQFTELNSEVYTGLLTHENKKNFLADFQDGNIDVAITTSSFGLGVDVDVDFVILANLMSSIEEMYQMFGRSGRHKDESDVYLIYNDRDINIQRFFLNQRFPDEVFLKDLYYYFKVKNKISGHINDLISFFGKEELLIQAGLFFLKTYKYINLQYNSSTNCFSGELIDKNCVLDVMWSKVQKQRESHQKMLNDQILFAESQGCYHSFISEYFGKKPKKCKKCLKNQEIRAKILE